jgi:hypothetical protein
MFPRGWFEEVAPFLGRFGRSQEQETLVRAVAEFIDGQIPENGPLWEICPCAAECWNGCVPPSSMSARLPWIGPEYPNGRVVAVGINSRDNGIYSDEIEGTVKIIDCLRAGRRQYGPGSNFHYRVAASVHAVLNGPRDDGRMPAPADSAEALLASARLQAVQCAPERANPRRTPTDEMVANCPPFLLAGQLGILRPRTVLMFGSAAHRLLESLDLQELVWRERWVDTRCFSRCSALVGNQSMVFLALDHPAYNARWDKSWAAMLESLRKLPAMVR